MIFKFKPNVECNYGSEDPYYALTSGGYIDPKELLEDPKQAQAVIDATKIVEEFLDEVNARYGEDAEYDDTEDEE